MARLAFSSPILTALTGRHWKAQPSDRLYGGVWSRKYPGGARDGLLDADERAILLAFAAELYVPNAMASAIVEPHHRGRARALYRDGQNVDCRRPRRADQRSYLAAFLASGVGIGGANVGIVLVVWGLSAAIGVTFGGVLSDRFGSKRVILSSLAMLAVAFFSMSTSVHLLSSAAVAGGRSSAHGWAD
jgi:hypothetical protein